MSFFFLTVFLIYGAMHGYAFFRARSAFGFGLAANISVAFFMLAMTLSPFLIRMLQRNEYELWARVLSYVAYLWMAALFLYVCVSLSMGAINLVFRGAGLLGVNSLSRLALTPRSSFIIGAGLALLICLYGYWSALDIRTERLRIETAKLPAGVDHLKIVQISDVHLGLIVREQRLKRILRIVKAEKPDILVSTGDLVDAQINRMSGLAELLREVHAPSGKYAITGNHEYYAGIEDALTFTRDAGFTLLRGESVRNGVINIVGVDDPAAIQMGKLKPVSETSLLPGLRKDRFTLLLKHRPAVDQKAAGLFDLQLSGHTHKGQIYPFKYVTERAYPLNSGRFDLPNGSILRVSRGCGTWGPPVRFLAPPEVTVIELVRKRAR